MGINGCFDFFFVAGDRVLLTADQRNYVISFATIINTVLRTVIICVMTAHQMNILLLYGCASALVIIKAGIIVCYSHNNYTYLDKKLCRIEALWKALGGNLSTDIRNYPNGCADSSRHNFVEFGFCQCVFNL